jgi:hypothetical protein
MFRFTLTPCDPEIEGFSVTGETISQAVVKTLEHVQDVFLADVDPEFWLPDMTEALHDCVNKFVRMDLPPIHKRRDFSSDESNFDLALTVE